MQMTQLRRLRENAELSAPQLAERAGVSYHTIHYHEIGRLKNVNQDTAERIASALGVVVNALFFETDTGTPIVESRLESGRITSGGQAVGNKPLERDDPEDSALSQLFDLVSSRGKRNHNSHMQFKTVVLIGGTPQEITDDGALDITEARAEELLEALQ